MSDPVDPMHTAGRWLVTTASGAMHLIESDDSGGTVIATRITARPKGHDPRYPLETLRRDGQTLRVTGVKHMVGTVVSNGIVVGEDMYLHLEPLDSAATLTVRRTTPVVQVEVLPPVASDG